MGKIRRKKEGFTLIELLVVIAIIGTLVAIVFLDLYDAQAKSRYTKVLSDMESISKAATAYAVNNNNFYPRNFDNGKPSEPDWTNLWAPYLPNWPDSPCSTYAYNWENLTIINNPDGSFNSCITHDDEVLNPNPSLGVTYRSLSSGGNSVFYYDMLNLSSCRAIIQGNNMVNIRNAPSKKITCKE